MGCTKEEEREEEEIPKDVEEDAEEEVAEAELKLPLEVQSGGFHSVSGWLDDETIVYVTESNEGALVYSYGLHTGEEQLLHRSNAPIVSLLISPSKEYLLIHSSPTSNEARITVVNDLGETVLSKELPSAEISLEWNPHAEHLVLLTTFTEDWNFSVWTLDIENKELTELALQQPFGTWIGEDRLLYLDWDLDDLAITAMLKEFHIGEKESKEFLEDIYHVDSFGDLFMTIQPKNSNDETAIYRFYNSSFEEVFSFETPQLRSYSGWVVPSYTYLEESNQFLIYQPLYSTEVDVYYDGFQLHSYQLETGEQEILFEGMTNEPISCSPNGVYCVSGYFLERLIDFERRELIPVVEVEK